MRQDHDQDVRLHEAERAVDRATALLERARVMRLGLTELRGRQAAVTAALDAALDEAKAGGTRHHQHVQRLRTQRELHVLHGLSTAGLTPATCPRTSSLAATGPHIAGMGSVLSSTAGPLKGGTYGLDLMAALEGAAPIDGVEPARVVDAAVPEQRAAQPELALVG